jgi:hypothetical protein
MYVYVIAQEHGIYEIVRLDASGGHEVVQTNIRTKEKANSACITWNKRELERDVSMGKLC